MKPGFALHETLELHEITAFKAVCLTKSKAMLGLAVDSELQKLLQADVALSTLHLTQLNRLLEKAAQ